MIAGVALLALGAVYEVKTPREALFPIQLFKDISCGTVTSVASLNAVFMDHGTVAILIVVFLHSFCFTAGTFYIAIYFQVRSQRTSNLWIRQFGGLTSHRLKGCEWNVSILRWDSFSSLFIRVYACLHPSGVVHGLLANQARKYECSKVDIVQWIDRWCF